MPSSQGQYKKCVWLVSLVIGYCVAITTDNFHKLPTCSPSSCEMCENYSTMLNATMNFSVNACDDFYGHACRQIYYPHLPSYAKIRHDSMMHHSNNAILQLAFEKLKTNQKTFNSKALQFTTDLYRECGDVSSRERVGKRPIVQLLGQVLGGGQQRWRTLFGEPKPFFAFVNHPDNETIDYYSQSSEDKFTKYWTVWKSKRQNMSKTEEKHADAPNVEQWMDSFVETALLDVKSSILEIDYQKSSNPIRGGYNRKIEIKFVEPSYVFNSSNMDKFGLYRELKSKIAFYFDINHPNDHQMNSSLTEVIFEIIDFKLKYAQLISGIKCGRDDRYDECFHNDYIRLAELKHNYTFDWTLLVDKFTNKLARHSSYRINQTEEYDVTIRPLAKLFGPLTQLIARTPIRVLQNVMALDILDNDNIKSLFKSQNERIDPKEVQSARLWNVFVGNEMIFEVFEGLYNRIYYDYVQREKLKSAEKRANEMLGNLKKTLKLNNLLSVSEHGETKQQTLARLDAIKLVILQTEWIFVDDLLDLSFFADGTALHSARYELVKGNYAATYFNLMRMLKSRHFRMISVEDHHWQYISNRMIAFHKSIFPRSTPKPNTIEIRRERLINEVFDSPIGLAYGSVGIEIAHKIFHELDKWNSMNQLAIKTSSQCFVRQYDEAFKSGQSIDEHEYYLINGTATLKANILDNAALRLAYDAFNKHLNQLESGSQCNSRIPFLERFTQQKLFFIAYVKNFCFFGPLYTKELRQSGYELPETPSSYRVNTTLSNLDQFARAFNCPVGSRMNPINKCQL